MHIYLPGGKDCFNFSAFSLSNITKVYRYREQRTLNLVLWRFFFILTAENKNITKYKKEVKYF